MKSRDVLAQRAALLVATLGCGLGSCSGAAGAGGPAPSPSHQKALIIAVQNHKDPQLNLNFTLQDSNSLKKTLEERAGIPKRNITVMNDESPDTLRPTLENMRRVLKDFLSGATPEDRLILFFSGHGFLQDGQTFLVPSDFQRGEPKTTGLPAAEFREALTRCVAGVKFLILDCCQAGGEKGLDDTTPPSETVAKGLDLQQVPGCIVLASCKANEKSYEWPEHQCSVFTYWLCRGLEGGADDDADGRLTEDELYRYAYDRVVKTVSQGLGGGRTQTPVRNIGVNISGPQEILTLRPESPETLCSRLAAHLDLETRLRKLKKVGVLEFLEPLGRTEGLVRANLPGYCAGRVRNELTRLAGRSYSVLDPDKMKAVAGGIKFSDLGEPDAMRGLATQGGGVDAIVSGTLRRRGRTLNLQCDLVSTADGESLVRPGGVLPITETLLADDGRSLDNRKRPEGKPHDEKVVDQAIKAGQKANPLLDKNFPYRIEVMSVKAAPGRPTQPTDPRVPKPLFLVKKDGTKSLALALAPGGAADDPQAAEGDLMIEANEGEVVEIWIRNNSDKRVGVALLIDGLNTYGKQPERLENAQVWVVGANEVNAVGAWYFPEAGNDETRHRDFIFRDVASLPAGRQHFGESVGTITAGFFAEALDRGLQLDEGAESKSVIRRTSFNRGNLLGAITIRYAGK